MSSQNVGFSLKAFRKRIRQPPCIINLLRSGVPSDLEFETAHKLLARYIVTKGLSSVQAKKMAQTMMENSTSFGRTNEVNLNQFVECLSRAQEDPLKYCWDCEEIWSSRSLRDRAACAGWRCEYYQTRPISKSNNERSENEDSMEKEIITYVLNNPEGLSDALGLNLRAEGFTDPYVTTSAIRLPFNRVLWHVCHYLDYHGRQIRYSSILATVNKSAVLGPHVDEIGRYLQQIKKRESCERDTFINYVHLVNVREARLRGQELVQMANAALTSNALPLEIILSTLRDQAQELLSKTGETARTIDEDLDRFVTNLFSKRDEVVPTPSEWLNSALGGGWRIGKLYVLTASSLRESTDFIEWCADFAAQHRFPTLYVSYAVTKEQFLERALVRYSGIDRTELARYRRNVSGSEEDERIMEKVVEAGERLSERVSSYLTVVEAKEAETQALGRVQNEIQATKDKPVLVIMGQSPSEPTTVESGADSLGAGICKELSLLAKLKRHLQDSPAAIVVVTAGNRTQNVSSCANGGTIGARSTTYVEDCGADYTLVLHSGRITLRGTGSENITDQLHLAREWYKRNLPKSRELVDSLFQEAKGSYPLDEACVYTRVAVSGRTTKALANPVIIYEWPYHRFRTLSAEPTELEKHGKSSFGKD